MVCEIVSIGTELVMGQIANTDAQYLSMRLSELGISVYHHTTVGDNPGRVKQALTTALGRADLVIATGGLGPTEDDITKQMVAEVIGREMVLHEPSLQALQSFFGGIGRTMSENNLRQVYFPKGAVIMPNEKGTAPGCIAEYGEKRIAVLPGPPHELTDMYEKQLMPYLAAQSDQVIASRFLQIYGIGESEVENRIADLTHDMNPSVALYCSPGNVMARVTMRAATRALAEAGIEPVEREIRKRLSGHVYGEGLGLTLAQAVAGLLISKNQTVAVAESLTGGMLASQLIDCPGVSASFLEGIVAYSNQAKVRLLGVREETLETEGAVSERAAIEMAEGARRVSGADWALSTTGIAGPGGATGTKPVGLCYVALSGKNGSCVKELRLRGDRTRIRLSAVQNALFMLYQNLG